LGIADLHFGSEHALAASDISDPTRVREVSRIKFDEAFSTASAMAHSHAGQGLSPISLSFRAARIVAAKRIAYFRWSLA